MPAKQVDLDALGAQYREAKAAVPAHLKKQADAELAVADWIKRHRAVPADLLYQAETGEAIDAELRELEEAMRRAEADVGWCRAVEVAAMEAYKGKPIAEILANNTAHRTQIGATRAKAMRLLEEQEDD